MSKQNNLTYEQFQERFRYNTTKEYHIGSGGQSDVYRAWDTHRRRWVAIKISKVKEEHISLKRETELVKKMLTHPNIAYYEECYRFNIPHTGKFDYAILEYYEEGNLLKFKNKLTIEQKQFILEQILNGLGFSHKKKIIHRDLKPKNILISREGEKFIPVISDFGICKSIERDKTAFINSVKMASPHYASPEQLDIENNLIDYNSDLWSFGIIALGLFLEALPFDIETLAKIKQGTLPPVDFLPEAWQIIVKECLKVNPKERIKSCDDCLKIIADNKPPRDDEKENGTQRINKIKKWIHLFNPFPNRQIRIKNIFIYSLVVSLLAVSVFTVYTLKSQLFSATIRVVNWDDWDESFLPTLELKTGGEIKLQQIDKKGSAEFNKIESKYNNEKVSIKITDTENMPYYLTDSVIQIHKDKISEIQVRLRGVEKLEAKVCDFDTREILPSASVTCADTTVITNESGKFLIDIPLEKRQKVQRVIIKKDGYKYYDQLCPFVEKSKPDTFYLQKKK